MLGVVLGNADEATLGEFGDLYDDGSVTPDKKQ